MKKKEQNFFYGMTFQVSKKKQQKSTKIISDDKNEKASASISINFF